MKANILKECTHFIPTHHFVSMASSAHQKYSANSLQQSSLAYFEQYQTCKMERFAKLVKEKTLINLEILWFLHNFRGRRKRLTNSLKAAQNQKGILAETKTSHILIRTFRLTSVHIYCVKNVQIRSFTSPYSVRIQENTDQKIRTLFTQCIFK